jgi:hypothetical protein
MGRTVLMGIAVLVGLGVACGPETGEVTPGDLVASWGPIRSCTRTSATPPRRST